MPVRIRVAATALVAVFVLLVALLPGTASGPCWKRVIGDWEANGRIDASYAVSCYRDALQRAERDRSPAALLAALRAGTRR